MSVFVLFLYFLVHALFSYSVFVISTSVIDCLPRFISKVTYCVSSGTFNLTNGLTYYLNKGQFYVLS